MERPLASTKAKLLARLLGYPMPEGNIYDLGSNLSIYSDDIARWLMSNMGLHCWVISLDSENPVLYRGRARIWTPVGDGYRGSINMSTKISRSYKIAFNDILEKAMESRMKSFGKSALPNDAPEISVPDRFIIDYPNQV